MRVVAEAAEGGAGQKATGDVMLSTRLPQAVHGPVQVPRGFGEVRGRPGRQGQAEMGASEAEVVEGYVDEPQAASKKLLCQH